MQTEQEKFITLIALDGSLQQYQVYEDFILRNKNLQEFIIKEKPTYKNWKDNIFNEGSDRYCQEGDIDRDSKYLSLRNIVISRTMKEKEEIIKRQCEILEIDFERVITTKKIPVIDSLMNLPEYLEYIGTEERKKRTCESAFGTKYCEEKLSYYI